MGDGRNFLKIFAPHPLMTTFRLIQLLARSVSLDSTFKRKKNNTNISAVGGGGGMYVHCTVLESHTVKEIHTVSVEHFLWSFFAFSSNIICLIHESLINYFCT
jgi:hypothetical protein